MFLTKHKNGIYYLYFNEPNGKRKKVSKRKRIKSEAYKFLLSYKSHLEDNHNVKLKNITLKKFILNYLIYSESIHSLNTTNTYKTTFNSLIDYYGDIPLSSFSQFKIKEFIQYKITTVTKYQARKDLISLSIALNKAVSDEYLHSNPCQGIKRIKIPEKQPVFFSGAEFEKLLVEIENKDISDLTVFAVNTGLRQMEILTLQWEQINFKNKLLTLDNRNHLTKSKKIRTIPLNIASMQILVDRELNKINNLVFTYKRNKLSHDQISKIFKKYIIKAKLNPKLNFHSLRHTFASWLVQRGVSIYRVSKLLGHSDIKTTEIYAHLTADDLRASVDLLNSGFD